MPRMSQNGLVLDIQKGSKMKFSGEDKILIILGFLLWPLWKPVAMAGIDFTKFFFTSFPGFIKLLLIIAVVGSIWTVIEYLLESKE